MLDTLPAVWVGDAPGDHFALELERAGAPLEVSDYATVALELYSPAGTLVVSVVGTIDAENECIEFAWPAAPAPLFTEAGVHTIVPRLTDEAGRILRADALEFVVQADDGWLSLGAARALWQGAPSDDVTLYMLLTAARESVAAYAAAVVPADATAGRVPLRFRTAQNMQARNVWNAGAVDPAGGLGDEGFVLRPFPLDWMVRQIIRPKTGTPVIG